MSCVSVTLAAELSQYDYHYLAILFNNLNIDR